MSSGERPIGAAKGKQSDTEALCHLPPPPPPNPQAPSLLIFQCVIQPRFSAQVLAGKLSASSGEWCGSPGSQIRAEKDRFLRHKYRAATLCTPLPNGLT